MTDHNKSYKVKANEFVFSIDKNQTAAADIIQKSPTEFNIINHHRSVNATLVDSDVTGKKLTIEVDGESYEVEIKDELDQMLDVMGFGIAATKQIKEVKAPMPGMVLEIVVLDGQDVNEGDKVLILGAMKMENCILVHTNAKIKRVAVSVGQAVEKGQVLVELE
jgi:biotin carboxyl carrier protein